MPWPTMSDYQDALQNPRLSFSDQELQRGVPLTDRLGLPKPVTGGFASVYQVNCNNRKWAVRCFLHYHQDIEQRYASIGRCLAQARLPYTAAFQYLRNGIRIRGQWYPALKMEWVEGEPLNSYVERVRRDRAAMQGLLDQFTRMSRDLRQAGIAHGDLQHGNIMVVGGALKLVDYDGMYVPDLRGMPSHEVGHPNYQHPGRSEKDFGPYLDSFSEWVIYLSLAGLSVQPELWDLAGGDEQLLFSRKDFADPKSSRMLKALESSPDQYVRQLSETFRSVLAIGNIAQIPPVDGSRPGMAVVLAPGTSMPAIGGLSRTSSTLAGSGPSGDSMKDNTWIVLGPDAPGLPPPPHAAAQENGALPEWIRDHMEAQPVELAPPFRTERLSLAGAVAVAGLLARFAALGYFTSQVAMYASLAGVFVAAALVVARYRGREEFRQKTMLMAQISVSKREIRRAEAAIGSIERERAKVTRKEAQSTGGLNSRISKLSGLEQEDLAKVDRWLLAFLDQSARQRDELGKAEAADLANAANILSILLLGRRAEAIMKEYRTKRERLLQQEQRAKVDASRERDAIRVKYVRRMGPVKQRLARLEAAYKADVADLDRRQEQEEQSLTLSKWNLQNMTRDLSLYSQVTFVAFVRKVLYLDRAKSVKAAP